MELTDEQIETLIENSDGHWREDTFRIDGPSLTALLRAAAQAASADVDREALELAERWKDVHTDESYGSAGKNLGILARALLRQSNSPRND